MKSGQKILQRIAQLPPQEQQIALGAVLFDRFQKLGVTLTIVGGAAVQYYSHAEYTTSDLDAILWGETTEKLEAVMAELGFKRTSSLRHFEHPALSFVVEFPPSPIEVGGRHISKVNLFKWEDLSVQVIRIEDILMDRIIAGVEWRSSGHLDQARLLWLKNRDRIDLDYLREFARQEGYTKTLNEILISSQRRAKSGKSPRKAKKK